MSRDITAVMITVDRSPGENYLSQTMQSLLKSDLLNSERLDSFILCSSGPVENRLPPNRNAARALALGVQADTEWILFLEDDIQVCHNFFDSVGAWLDKHASIPDQEFPFYVFGSAHHRLLTKQPLLGNFVDLPVQEFYGTQCFAIRRSEAVSLSQYLMSTNDSPGEYDLSMHTWAHKYFLGKQDDYYRASCPSFVQHIGQNSFIRPNGVEVVFPSFRGEEWSYV